MSCRGMQEGWTPRARRSPRWLAILPLLASLMGCRERFPSASLETLNYPPEWSAEAVAHVGLAEDPDQALVTVGDVRVDPGGRIYVVQAGDAQVRVFGPAGDLQLIVGGRGEGPGEFVRLSGIGFREDTLYVSDAGLHRTSFFDTQARFIRSESWESLRIPAGEVGGGTAAFITSAPQVLLPDGSGLIRPEMRVNIAAAAVQPGSSRTSVPALIARIRRGVPALDTIVVYEIVNRVTRAPSSEGAPGIVDCPFSLDPMAELMVDGSGAVLVQRPLASRTDRAEYRLILVGPSRDTIFTASIP